MVEGPGQGTRLDATPANTHGGVMRKLDCRKCGKMLIELEKGRIAAKGVALYCLECDPSKSKEEPLNFGDLFRGFAKK